MYPKSITRCISEYICMFLYPLWPGGAALLTHARAVRHGGPERKREVDPAEHHGRLGELLRTCRDCYLSL